MPFTVIDKNSFANANSELAKGVLELLAYALLAEGGNKSVVSSMNAYGMSLPGIDGLSLNDDGTLSTESKDLESNANIINANYKSLGFEKLQKSTTWDEDKLNKYISQKLKSRCEDGYEMIIMTNDDGNVIGVASGNNNAEKMLHTQDKYGDFRLLNFVIHPDQRKNGNGTKLLQELHNHVLTKSSAKNNPKIVTPISNPDLLPVYQKMCRSDIMGYCGLEYNAVYVNMNDGKDRQSLPFDGVELPETPEGKKFVQVEQTTSLEKLQQLGKHTASFIQAKAAALREMFGGKY